MLAEQLELVRWSIDDADRVSYHAAACIASNHLVALLDQVRRVAPIPLEAFLPLVGATVENVTALGPAAALTGPVARGDVETVRRHLDVLAGPDRDAYRDLARLAQQLPAVTTPPSTRCSDDRRRAGGGAARVSATKRGAPAGRSAWCRRWATSTRGTAHSCVRRGTRRISSWSRCS